MAIKIEDILDTKKNPNLADLMADEDLAALGLKVVEGFENDLQSREGWQEQVSEGLKLALQVKEDKTFPWAKASNVKFPIITVAALQFSARAYPALIPDANVVKTKIFGEMSDEKTARANRISKHMSYQLLEEDEDWEPEMDRLLIGVPIVGCAFKKSYFSPEKGHNCSEHVLAQDFVVDYWCKSLATAYRKTHRYYLDKNQVLSRKRRGFFLDIDFGKPQKHVNIALEGTNESQGTQDNDSENLPREILEQHTYLDLDGDGYEEPYIITVDRSSAKVARVVPRFEEDAVEMIDGVISDIKPTEHFTKYGFIPSPDGGFYDLGFGHLLGPLSHSVDTTINQLIDSGTLSNLQGGFLGRGVKLKSGNSRFEPGEWKRANSTGDDLRKNIVPLPVQQPSQVLFQLLGLLIEYSERITSVSDMMSGQNPGQNQPATTSMAVLEQGMTVFSAVFKRIHRAMRDEFRVLYRMNQIYLKPDSKYHYEDVMQQALQADYTNPLEIKPASDPKMVSDMQKAVKAEALVGRAYAVPGYDTDKAERRYLQALGIEDIEEVFPDPKGKNAIAPKPNLEFEKLKLEQDTAKITLMKDFAQLTIEAGIADARIVEMQTNGLKNIAEAESKEVGPQLELYKVQLQDMADRREKMTKIVEALKNDADRVGSVENAPSN